MNTPRMFSLILITLSLRTTSLLAQEPKINCPQGSFLGEGVTQFMVTASPETLYPHIGDFYSPSWGEIIFPQDNFTFNPPTRTINKTITEYLLSNNSSPDNFNLRWELESNNFNPTGQFDVVYYQQHILVIPVCTGGLLASVTWKIRACVSGDMGIGLRWFDELHERAARNVFAGIADGWMGGPETGVGNCYGLNSTGTDVKNDTMPDGGEQSPGDNDDGSYIPVPELQGEGVRGRDIGRSIAVGIILVGVFAAL